MSNLLELKNLCKTYGNKCAIEDINLSLESGKIIGLLGPNGSGKTTILKLINGLLTPTRGEVLIEGDKPSKYTRKIVSYLPEKTYLNEWMKVSDILQFFTDFYSDFDGERAIKMLTELHIDLNDKLKTMSKGTKEKVQLILVMSRNAKIYLLDEPIGGVDPATRDYILNTIIKNYNPNAIVIISTHLIQDVEQIFDEVIFISDKHVFLHDSVDNIREKYGKSIDGLFREVFKC